MSFQNRDTMLDYLNKELSLTKSKCSEIIENLEKLEFLDTLIQNNEQVNCSICNKIRTTLFHCMLCNDKVCNNDICTWKCRDCKMKMCSECYNYSNGCEYCDKNKQYKSYAVIIFGNKWGTIKYFELTHNYYLALEIYRKYVNNNEKYLFAESDDRGFKFISKGEKDYTKTNITTLENDFNTSNDELGIATLIAFTENIKTVNIAFMDEIEKWIEVADDTEETYQYISDTYSLDEYKPYNELINNI